uniref:Ovule protein n=1 Tax=Panagrellus redivivus TaxID=6233 RepID=A0A7E4VXY2_PANRE
MPCQSQLNISNPVKTWLSIVSDRFFGGYPSKSMTSPVAAYMYFYFLPPKHGKQNNAFQVWSFGSLSTSSSGLFSAPAGDQGIPIPPEH